MISAELGPISLLYGQSNAVLRSHDPIHSLISQRKQILRWHVVSMIGQQALDY